MYDAKNIFYAIFTYNAPYDCWFESNFHLIEKVCDRFRFFLCSYPYRIQYRCKNRHSDVVFNNNNNNNNDILLLTHGPYLKHRSTNCGYLYISTHYRNGVCTWPTLRGEKRFILTTAVLSFVRAQKMDNHTVAHYTTGVSTCPTLRGAKHFPSTSYFFMPGVYTVSTYFYYTKAIAYWWDADTETIHGQLLHLVSTI